MKSEAEVRANYEAVRADRIAGAEPGYDKGYIDGVHTALMWVLDELPT